MILGQPYMMIASAKEVIIPDPEPTVLLDISGGFETGDEGFDAKLYAARNASAARNGSWGMRIRTFEANGHAYKKFNIFVPLGATVFASAYTKVGSEGTNTYRSLLIGNLAGTDLSYTNVTTGGSGWVYSTVSHTVVKGGDDWVFQVANSIQPYNSSTRSQNGSQSETFFDDWSIKVTTP